MKKITSLHWDPTPVDVLTSPAGASPHHYITKGKDPNHNNGGNRVAIVIMLVTYILETTVPPYAL